MSQVLQFILLVNEHGLILIHDTSLIARYLLQLRLQLFVLALQIVTMLELSDQRILLLQLLKHALADLLVFGILLLQRRLLLVQHIDLTFQLHIASALHSQLRSQLSNELTTTSQLLAQFHPLRLKCRRLSIGSLCLRKLTLEARNLLLASLALICGLLQLLRHVLDDVSLLEHKCLAQLSLLFVFLVGALLYLDAKSGGLSLPSKLIEVLLGLLELPLLVLYDLLLFVNEGFLVGDLHRLLVN